jgi:hypothetical protein
LATFRFGARKQFELGLVHGLAGPLLSSELNFGLFVRSRGGASIMRVS